MSKKGNFKTQEPVFGKSQFLSSTQFTSVEKDILNAVLQEEKMYTMEQARNLLRDFLKKEAQ